MDTKNVELAKVLKDGGFYGSRGTWNAIIQLPGDPKIYRKRVETLIVRNGKDIFLKKKPDGSYCLPGGSSEKDIDDIEQAANECREEARVKVKNLFNSGITYKEIISPKDWHKDASISWDGNFNTVFVGEYEEKDHDFVDRKDQDPFIASGQFYPIKNCWSILSQPHIKALKMYISMKNETPKEQDEIIEESYIFNYFKNKKLLKDYSTKTDFTGNEIDDIINKLDRSYSEFKTKSKVQRIIGTKEAADFIFPAMVMTFDREGKSITFAISYYDDKNEEACAFTSPDLGDVVLLFPNYFKRKKEVKKFVLLHEIGHIRLGHTYEKNMHKNIFGEIDEDERRIKYSKKGKTVYQELNADLYAILHGAKMYAILSVSSNEDLSKQYDYRISNAELANRYLNVYNVYHKYKPTNHNVAYEFTDFDFVNLAIHDFVYENERISSISQTEKSVLNELLFEHCIEKKIDSNKHIDVMTEKAKALNDADLIEESKEERFFYDRRMFNESTHFTEKEGYLLDNFITKRDEAKQYVLETVDGLLEKLKGSLLSQPENPILNRYQTLLEAATKRKNLPDHKFGIPELRKYPLDTRQHVISAIKLFGHYAGSSYAKELATAILNAMEKYHISRDQIGEKNKLRNYM